MAVDAAGLAAVLGVPETEAARLLPIASELVTAYLRGSRTCPDAIRDEAIIRTAGHVDKARVGFGAVEGRMKVGSLETNLRPAGVSAVRQSGAAGLLAPWVRRTA